MTKKTRWMQQPLVAFLSLLLLHHPLPMSGWQGGDSPLEIDVLEGDGVSHAIARGRFRDPVVEVQKGGQPVKGTTVVFRLPESGPGGSFGNSGTIRGTNTGKNGRAVGEGFKPNKELGDFVIRVTATFQNEAAEAELRQKNTWLDSAITDKKIKVWLNDGRKITGRVGKVSGEGFTMTDKRLNEIVTIADAEVVKVNLKPWSTGKKVGIGAAIGVIGMSAAIAIACGNGCN